MSHRIDRLPLMSSSPGTHRSITVHRFGQPGARPKAYVQAALHANETPGLLIAHHLLDILAEADREGRIQGEVVLVPSANPIGLSDNVLGNQIGREALDGGGNYNRGWPDISGPAIAKLKGALGTDAEYNRDSVREALRAAVEALDPANEVQSLQCLLLGQAVDADIVVDIHTELAAVAGMVVAPWSLPAMDGLIDEIAPEVVHVTDTPRLFESTCSGAWHDVRKAFPDAAVDQGCIAATIEMRGVGDVQDAIARGDAEAIVRFLARKGVLAHDFTQAGIWKGDKTPHEAIVMQRTPVGGVIVYRQPLGARVEKGAHIADIVDPVADEAAFARTPIYAAHAGTLYAYILNHLVRPNDIVVKIAGPEVWKPMR